MITAALVAGCGDGGDEPTTTSAAQVNAAQAEANAKTQKRNEQVREQYEKRQRAAAPSEAEAEVAARTTSFYEALGAGQAKGAEAEVADPAEIEIDTATFCDLMSAEALAQTVRYAEVASGIAKEWDCEAAVRLLVNRSKKSGGFEDVRSAEVLGVNVAGDKATATVRFGEGAATSVPLVKEDGEWKLAGAAVGAAR